jgi:hypothetical protein
MVCSLGTILSHHPGHDTKIITVQAKADGKNFANGGGLQQQLVNAASATCQQHANSMASDPGFICSATSKVNITVSAV